MRTRWLGALLGFGAHALLGVTVWFLFPFLIFGVAWRWIRSEELPAGGVKTIGAMLFATADHFWPIQRSN